MVYSLRVIGLLIGIVVIVLVETGDVLSADWSADNVGHIDSYISADIKGSSAVVDNHLSFVMMRAQVLVCMTGERVASFAALKFFFSRDDQLVLHLQMSWSRIS